MQEQAMEQITETEQVATEIQETATGKPLATQDMEKMDTATIITTNKEKIGILENGQVTRSCGTIQALRTRSSTPTRTWMKKEIGQKDMILKKMKTIQIKRKKKKTSLIRLSEKHTFRHIIKPWQTTDKI